MEKFNTQALPHRGARYIFILLLLALLGACSSLKLAYNNGDTLLFWWLDAYIDLTSDQKPGVKSDIGDLLHWHRKTQLQDYVQILRSGQRQLQGTPSVAELQADYRAARSRAETVLMKAVPDLAELALKLTPAQITVMEAKFDKNNRDFRKKNMQGDRSEQMKFRYKKSMEQFELWFGSFSREQESMIRKASDARPLDNELWLDERMRRQQRIVELARKIQQERPAQAVAEGWIRELVQDLFDRMEQPSERKGFFDAYLASNVAFVHTVVGLTTPQQKAHAHQRIQGWIDDLNALAAK